MGKFKLLAGAMLVDSHSAGNRQLPQDVRLNVGALKTRIYGATVWGASTFEGDTVCLISGAAEIQITDETDHRLDTIGACLRREPSGLLRNLSADSDRILAAAIAATNYSDNPAENTAAAKTVTDAAPLKPLVKPGKPVKAAPSTTIAVVSAEPAEAAAATPIAVAKSANGWTVVVLSLATAAPIEARTQSLHDQGLPAVARSASVQGKPVHRVTIGQFVTQAEALAYAHGTLAKAGLKGWPEPL